MDVFYSAVLRSIYCNYLTLSEKPNCLMFKGEGTPEENLKWRNLLFVSQPTKLKTVVYTLR